MSAFNYSVPLKCFVASGGNINQSKVSDKQKYVSLGNVVKLLIFMCCCNALLYTLTAGPLQCSIAMLGSDIGIPHYSVNMSAESI